MEGLNAPSLDTALFAAQINRQRSLAGNLQGNQTNTENGVPEATKAKLRQKAQEFESFYIYQVIELMAPKENATVMSGGAGEEMFRHKLNEELAANMSKSGGFGLADKVYTELLRQQEGKSNPSNVPAY